MNEASDRALVAAYFRGDDRALESLVRRYLRPVWRFVYRYAADAAAADDLTQETFVRAWRHLKRFDPDKSFKTWIFSIAKNAALDFLKKKKSVPFSVFDDADGNNMITDTFADPGPLPAELAEKVGLKKTLAGVVKRLSPSYRAVLQLRYDSELNFREIAELLGESLNTVKSRHRRALFMLRKSAAEF